MDASSQTIAKISEIAPTIRPMTEADAEAVARIEGVSFGSPWSARSFRELLALENSRSTVAADERGETIGYAVAIAVLDEIHLLNLAVAPERRRRGVGAALYDEMAAALKAAGGAILYLEVRPSNAAALALYRSRGLKPAGLRRGYYTDSGEDAIVMAGVV